jgi:hypothetical protein
MSSTAFNLLLAILLLAANAFYVAAEFALVKSRGFRIKAMVEQDRQQQVERGRTHMRLVKAPRDACAAPRPRNPVLIPTTSVAGNRAPAPARRRWRPPRGRPPAAG